MVIRGDVISGSTTISAADTTRDGHKLIVTAGTMTIDGPHGVRGAGRPVGSERDEVIDHDPPRAAPDLSVPAGTVFIACGRIDRRSGKGYLGGHAGGNPNEEGRTIGNALGSSVNVGGSHGGLGGVGDTGSAASIYGSILGPAGIRRRRRHGLLRGKQWRRSHSASRRVGRSRWRDHRCRSRSGAMLGGAGGSINMIIDRLSGSGRVSATRAMAITGAGGGGRVAVRYSDLSGLGQGADHGKRWNRLGEGLSGYRLSEVELANLRRSHHHNGGSDNSPHTPPGNGSAATIRQCHGAEFRKSHLAR